MLKSMVQQLAYRGWHRVNRQAKRVADWSGGGDGGAEDRQRQETEDKLQVHSRLMIVAQVLVSCWILFYLPS